MLQQEFWKKAVQTLEVKSNIPWEPQPGPQEELLNSHKIFEVFFGGARGGGKTDGMLGEWMDHARRYGKNARGVFFRRRSKNLEDVIDRSKGLFPKVGATWNGADLTWTWPNGAVLKFRHLWDEAACENYQGHAYTRVYFEEIQQWPDPAPINRLRATLRSSAGVPVGFRATGNPGGPGHNWVRARYVSPCITGYKQIYDDDTGEERIFIPSRLEDNVLLTEADPMYERRLHGSGSELLVKAWRYGMWNITAGGFFDDLFDERTHIIPPFEIPEGWIIRRSFDWGSARPSSLGLWAISNGEIIEREGLYFPPGSMIRIGEWYTVKRKHGSAIPNKGLRLSNQELGVGIAQKSKNMNLRGCVADPAIFVQQGGPSIYDQMKAAAVSRGHRLKFDRADNSRVAGWQRVRDMLKSARDNRMEDPGMYVFETCTEWIRTFPVLARSEKNLDDVDTTTEDHAADETRYAAMVGTPSAIKIQEFMI